jgi:hypothetical protein
MNEKFKNLGRALSKEEQKKVLGGVEGGGNGCAVVCNGNSYWVNGCSDGRDAECTETGYYKCSDHSFVALCSSN